MKKILVLGLVLALMAILLVPVAAFAVPTDTADVTGTVVVATIDVDAPTFAGGFGDFDPGVNRIASTNDGSVTVVNNSQAPTGWSVTAKDISYGGYMWNGVNTLQDKLYISPDNWVSYATAELGVSWTNPSTLPTWLEQTIANNEAAGAYSITITYTGSLTF